MQSTSNSISTAKTFQILGVASLALGLGTVLFASFAYLPGHPDFTIWNTYLSDIGDTAGWPQILFNAGTLLAAPLRFLIVVLLVLRLHSFGTSSRRFDIALLTVGAISTFGTIAMTATPFSVAPQVHKSGILMYFLGVVFLQSMIGFKELQLKGLPRILPILSFALVACFVIFFVLMVLYMTGTVGRTTPIFWEWLCFFASMAWLFGHTLVLGKNRP
jgi:hypothetical membrane protein